MVICQIVRVKKEESVVFVLLPDNRILRVPKVFIEEYHKGSLSLNQIVHLTIGEETLETYVFYYSKN